MVNRYRLIICLHVERPLSRLHNKCVRVTNRGSRQKINIYQAHSISQYEPALGLISLNSHYKPIMTIGCLTD